MPPGLDSLTVLRLTRLARTVMDQRLERPSRYRFSSRMPRVPARNGELTGYMHSRVYIAPIIARDAVAPIYSTGKMTVEMTELPKIKMGLGFSEAQLEVLRDMRRGLQVSDSALVEMLLPSVNRALEGIAVREEQMATAMMSDSFNYDYLGFKAEGVSWGMPSDLKTTTSVPWTTAASATPIDDILNFMYQAGVRHGVTFNRITMSSRAFRYAIATTEYANKAGALLPAQLTMGTNLTLTPSMGNQRMFEQLLGTQSSGQVGVTVELNDDRYWWQDSTGADYSARYQPINEVYFDNTAYDGDENVWNIGEGEPMESAFMDLNAPSVIGANTVTGLETSRGPLSYLTLASPDLQPPGLNLWAVTVSWPRKFMRQATAKMTVGSFTDDITITDPY